MSEKLFLSDYLKPIESGLRPAGGVNTEDGDIPSLGGENIRLEGGINYDTIKLIPRDFFERLNRGILQEADVLINKDGANTGKVGIYLPAKFKEAAINEHLFLIRGLDGILDQQFLYYSLLSETGQTILSKQITGTAQPGLNSSFIQKYPFVPPSFGKQRHIARILSTADAVIEKTQAAIAKYKAIKQGMLQDLFTRGLRSEKVKVKSEKGEWMEKEVWKLRPRYEDAPHLYKPARPSGGESKLGWIPREWVVEIVDDIAKVNGRVGWKGYTVADLRDFGPLALGATHIDKENKLDLTNPIHLSMEKYIESPEIMVQFGDLLIVQRGTIGKIVVVDKQIGEATINPSMVLLNRIRINNFFLYYQLCSFIGQLQIELLTTQTGVPMISQEQIKNINLIVPKNPKETDAIAERLKNIDSILENEKSYLLKMQSLKKGLMEDLLSGRVKVSEPLIATD